MFIVICQKYWEMLKKIPIRGLSVKFVDYLNKI